MGFTKWPNVSMKLKGKKVKNSYPREKSPGWQNTFYNLFTIHINIIHLL